MEQSKQKYEMNPEQATTFDPKYKPPPKEKNGIESGPEEQGFFNRKRVMIVLCASFVVVVGGGLLVNISKTKPKGTASEGEAAAARPPSEFLRSLRERGERTEKPAGSPDGNKQETELPEPAAMPAVSFNDRPQPDSERPYSAADAAGTPPASVPPPPPARSGGGGGGGGAAAVPAAYRSPLVPQTIAGSLFGGSAAPQRSGSYAEQYPYLEAGANTGQNAVDEYLKRAAAASQAVPAFGAAAAADDYARQNDQGNKQQFYDSASGGGAVNNGRFLGDNAIWIGTVIPGVLETGINTDLPGNVLARVMRHVYDSRTGSKLLIPQGTILLARYNSSVSYAQHRVQIVWDTMIRPDGFQIDLGGMNGVDTAGLSGQRAVYHENWFEYLKAAGIITMFSLANSKMTEEAAKYASAAAASGVAQANSELVNQLGGSIASRAMNIQPTLTVENGTPVNIMLNKTLYLPPADDYPPAQKYILE
jgi:type IV secretion system protein VirB10